MLEPHRRIRWGPAQDWALAGADQSLLGAKIERGLREKLQAIVADDILVVADREFGVPGEGVGKLRDDVFRNCATVVADDLDLIHWVTLRIPTVSGR